VLRNGGNAVDAAVTAAGVLAVVEPTMTGIGGDLFAIVHNGRSGRTYGLNASGRSPHAASLGRLRDSGVSAVPDRGILAVTVPGAVDGWSVLLAEHGTRSLRQTLAPAIACARDGFPVAEIVARQWHDATPLLAADPAASAVFLPAGRAPRPGEMFANPALASTLELIAEQGAETFYRGDLARLIARDADRRGGWLTAADLGDHQSEWVDPIRANRGEVELVELPPNTQGFVALEALNILADDDLRRLGHNTPAYLHLVLEALAIAFADRQAYLADPAAVPEATLSRLISLDYARERRREISADHTGSHPAGRMGLTENRDRGAGPGLNPGSGDTVYLAAADDQGNMVSLIQSLYTSFGAGIVAADTGIVLHNRGSLFATDPAHPNHLAPHKRPLHTLAPAMAFRHGRPWLTYGVMGGDMQPQGHLQVLLNLICFDMNIQQAGEAPRARYDPSGISLEPGIAAATGDGLRRRGHTLGPADGVAGRTGFGGFQGVLVDPETGVLMGGSDPRKDGLAVGW
jgi:gamma-glutamyltranspeptidase/glutathione hydrolase